MKRWVAVTGVLLIALVSIPVLASLILGQKGQLVWVDATGKVVGTSFGDSSVAIELADGTMVIGGIDFAAPGWEVVGRGGLQYESVDCTGQPYVLNPLLFGPSDVQLVIGHHGDLYSYDLTSFTEITRRSFSSGSICSDSTTMLVEAHPTTLEEAAFLDQFTQLVHLEHLPVPEPSAAALQASALAILAALSSRN